MKTVLITGANGNLGKVTVEKFIAEGYTVIALVRSRKSLAIVDDSLYVYQADLTNEEQTSSAIADIVQQHKRIDVALLLAGGFAMGSIIQTDRKHVEEMLTLNFFTAYHVVRKVFEQMLAQSEGGRIVLIGSKPAIENQGGHNMLAYTLSKAMIIKLSELLNLEGQRKNINTFVIVPSTIDTEANRKAMPDADFNKWVKPEDIVNTILFACSATSNAIHNGVFKLYAEA